MNEVFRLALNISILIIISAFTESLTEGTRCAKYVRSAVSVVMVIAVVGFISGFKPEISKTDTIGSYSIDYTEVWDETLKTVSASLETQMNEYCRSYGLDITDIDVKLKTDYEKISVESVEIAGVDAIAAKNLIAGHFKLGLAYINTNGVK